MSSCDKIANLVSLHQAALDQRIVEAVYAVDLETLHAAIPVFSKMSSNGRVRALLAFLSTDRSEECIDLLVSMQEASPKRIEYFLSAINKVVEGDRDDVLRKIYASHSHILDDGELLVHAAMNGSVNCLKLLGGVDEDVLLTSLCLASFRGHCRFLRALLKRCVDARIPEDRVKVRLLKALAPSALSGRRDCVAVVCSRVDAGDITEVIKAIASTRSPRKNAAIQMLERELEVKSRNNAMGKDAGARQRGPVCSL